MTEQHKPRICIVNTPGEINASRSGFVSPLEVAPKLQTIADVDVLELHDSNRDLSLISSDIAEIIHARRKSYRGFVVTGAKYDLHLIASRLAFAFGPGLDKTVALTGTDIPAYEIISNASQDLARATMVAASNFNEVVISYDDSILRGVTARMTTHGFSSRMTYEPPWGKYELMGAITASGLELYQRKETKAEDTFHNDFQRGIPTVSLHPGSDPEFTSESVASASENLKGLVFIVPSFSQLTAARMPYSHLGLLVDLKRDGIPVLITKDTLDTPEDLSNSFHEEALMRFDAIPGKYMSPQVAIAKFSWAVGRVTKQIELGEVAAKDKIARVSEIMRKPYVGEFGIYQPFTE